MTTIMSVDMSKSTGFAIGAVEGPPRPVFGTWMMPGMANMGAAWVHLQNTLEDAMQVYKPDVLVYAVPFAKMQTTARYLLGMAAHAESSAYRMSVRCYEVMESTARKAILGQGRFVTKDADGRNIKGSGTRGAKDAAVTWCENRGWDVGGDDNQADALVIYEFTKRFILSRQQWGQWQK
ncbi:MAG: hypothetical protein ACEQSH_00380 [Bacteroidia bacterium]